MAVAVFISSGLVRLLLVTSGLIAASSVVIAAVLPIRSRASMNVADRSVALVKSIVGMTWHIHSVTLAQGNMTMTTN